MRKFLLFSLLLSTAAATPALASPQDDPVARPSRVERQQAREVRQQAREQRAVGSERPQSIGRNSGDGGTGGDRPHLHGGGDSGAPRVSGGESGTPQVGGGDSGPAQVSDGGSAGRPGPHRMDNPQHGFTSGGPRHGNGRDSAQGGGSSTEQVHVAPGPRVVRNPFEESAVREVRSGRTEQVIERRQRLVDEGGQVHEVHPHMVTTDTLRQTDGARPHLRRTSAPVVSDVPRAGTQPPLRTDAHRHSRPEWSTNWRHDRRYDWRDWRNHHHNWFHLGFYYDPFGWGYQPYSIGWRLWPSYYGTNYWISDPWQYRLPYAHLGTRWIRYYDDAILVDTFTGEVLDVIQGFFW